MAMTCSQASAGKGEGRRVPSLRDLEKLSHLQMPCNVPALYSTSQMGQTLALVVPSSVIAIPVAPFPKNTSVLLAGGARKELYSKCHLPKPLGMASHWQDTLSHTRYRKNPTESSPSLKAPEHSSQAGFIIPGLGGERRGEKGNKTCHN